MAALDRISEKWKWRFLLLIQYILSISKCARILTLQETSNVTLNCTSQSLLDVSVSWTFNGMPAPFNQTFLSCDYGSGNEKKLMPTNDNSETCIQNSSLHLQNFQVCHQGIYKCIDSLSNATYEEYNVTISQGSPRPLKLSTTSSRYIQVEPDTDISLEVAVNNIVPEEDIIWQLNGALIGSNNHFDILNCQTNSVFSFEKIKEMNSGIYTILVRNSAGNDSINFQVCVTYSPVITSPQSVTSPAMATFTCVIPGLQANIAWADPDGNMLMPGNNVYINTAPDNGNTDNLMSQVQLSMTTASISGLYTCIVNDVNGCNATSVSANLTVLVVPNITSYLPAGSSRYVVNVTDNIIFQCTATGVPPPDILWYRGNDLLNSSNDRVTIGNLSVNEPERALATVTRELTLSQTSTSDASSNYTCRATNKNTTKGEQESKRFELFVQVPPQVVSLAPNQKVVAVSGREATLSFKITSAIPMVQTSDIRWYYAANTSSGSPDFTSEDFQDITNLMNRTSVSTIVINSNRLTLKISNIVQAIGNVTETVQGRYYLSATNPAGEGNNYTEVEVRVVPNITSYLPAGSSRYIINVTDDIIFQCTATGVPPPDIQWYRGNDLLNSSNDRITIGNLSVDESERNTVTRELILSQTSLSDASNNYSCRATNAADGGLDSEVFELYVQDFPQVTINLPNLQVHRGGKAQIHCSTGFHHHSLTWYYSNLWGSGQTLITNSTKYHISLQGSMTVLSVANVTYEDEGLYTCSVANHHVGNISASSTLTVFDNPTTPTNFNALYTSNCQNISLNWTTPGKGVRCFSFDIEISSANFITSINFTHNCTWNESKRVHKFNFAAPSKLNMDINAEIKVKSCNNYNCSNPARTKIIPGNCIKSNMNSLQVVALSVSLGGFLAILLLGAALIIIVAIIIFNNKKESKKSQCNNGIEMLKLSNMSSQLSCKTSKSSLSYFPPEPGSEVRQPIVLQFLSAHVESMHQNENCGFIEEYRIIGEKSPTKPADICHLDDNSHKNRYRNIKCFDETRVILKYEEDTNNYINANFIEGYNHPREYIASQGPLPCTLSDFWQMVWEYDAPTVVMLTNLVEKMKLKCSQYWPDSGTANYGNFEVTLVNETSQADFVIRDFKINYEGDDETTKEVKQFHFISWPDFGVPRQATPLLYFLRRIRSFHKYSDSRPMVFHCSAGVGRTGTLITIDVELQRTEKESLVDPFNSVLKLREQRNFMVQAEAQYVFLHDAILEGIQSGKTEVFAPKLSEKMKELEEKNEENESGYKQEFVLLRQVKVDVREFSVASEDTNKFKNRVMNALPFNHNRVVLNKKPGISGSDYINASFVDSYSKKAAYIVTQGPLPNTVDDFWRMIWEKSVTTIVMLTQLVEKEKDQCACYWPENKGEVLDVSDFTVELWKENNYGDYSTREMAVVDKETEKSIMVQQFHFTGWPEIGAPASGAGMVDLVDQVIRRQQHTGDKPIVVHCSAGVGRTGAFCCLNIAIERVQSEGTVDIFHTIKTLRTQRAHMIQNETQYKFCYRALLDYVESLENYSNLK